MCRIFVDLLNKLFDLNLEVYLFIKLENVMGSLLFWGKKRRVFGIILGVFVLYLWGYLIEKLRYLNIKKFCVGMNYVWWLILILNRIIWV